MDGGVGTQADTFAIPGIRGKIDHSHDGGLRIKVERDTADGEFTYPRRSCLAMVVEKCTQIFQSQHDGEYAAGWIKNKPKSLKSSVPKERLTVEVCRCAESQEGLSDGKDSPEAVAR